MSNPKDLVGAKKAPLDLVPVAGAIESAPAHAHGAKKYGPFNWRANPVQAMTYIGAVQRHLAAWVDGQDEAEDTGIHHFGHIIAGMNILADAKALGNLIDNRPPKGPAADMLRAQDHSEAPAVEETPSSFACKHRDGTCAECAPTRVEPIKPLEGPVADILLPIVERKMDQMRDDAEHDRNCPLCRSFEQARSDRQALSDLPEPYRELGGEG